MKRKKDQVRFSQLMKGLAGVFDSKGTLSPVKIELYFKALEDLTIEQIEKSVCELVRDREYSTMPLPADIRRIIQPGNLLTGLRAWLLVEKCLEGGPKPQDPAINAAVEGMGGYDRLGRLPYHELTWTQKDFERRYQLFSESFNLLEIPGPEKQPLRIVEKTSRKDGE